MRSWRWVWLGICLLSAQSALADQPLPPPLQDVGITEHLGSTLPADLQLTNAAGQSVALGSFFDGKRPVVLVLQYYECPMLCGLLMNGVNTVLKALPWTVGTEYQFVGVSIDPDEGPDLALAKQKAYTEAFGRESQWNFLVGSAAAIKQLTDAVGFGYRFDATQQEFAHAAVVTILTPQGKISRYLYGVEFKPRDMKLALVEAGEGKVGTVMDRLLLFCFHYDPATRGYSLMAFRLMQAGGIGIIGGLIALFVRLRRNERRKNHEGAT